MQQFWEKNWSFFVSYICISERGRIARSCKCVHATNFLFLIFWNKTLYINEDFLFFQAFAYLNAGAFFSKEHATNFVRRIDGLMGEVFLSPPLIPPFFFGAICNQNFCFAHTKAHTNTHIQTYTYTYTHTHTGSNRAGILCVHTQFCAYIRSSVRTYAVLCVHTHRTTARSDVLCVCVRVCACVCLCVCVCVCECVCVCVYVWC